MKRVIPAVPYVFAALGSLVLLLAYSSMHWATRYDSLGLSDFKEGPTALLVAAAFGSLILSVVAVIYRSLWPRGLLVATALATTVCAVAVAASSMAAANTDRVTATSETVIQTDMIITSYQRGAVIGVGAALLALVFALLGLALYPLLRTAGADSTGDE